MSGRVLLTCALLLCVDRKTRAGTTIEVETDTLKRSVFMNDKGVAITGRDTLLMQVKACSSAYIFLSQIHTINTKGARYFLLSLGADHNDIMDSCLKPCLRQSSTVKGYWLDCNSFKTFWLSWDSTGRLRVGKGFTVGKNTLIMLRSPEPFQVNSLIIHGKTKPIKWRFIQDAPPEFVFPAPHGGTVTEIPENTDTKKVVFELAASDPDKDIVRFSVTGEWADTFQCSGSSVVLVKSLDYEARSFYTLRIVAKDEFNSVTAVLTVVVTDVNDNYPEITSISPLRVPEQLPAGTVVGAITSARDVDTGDTLTYSLSGFGAQFYTVDPHTGVLYVRNEVDLDKVNQQSLVLRVSLTVRDEAQHKTDRGFNVTVYDINDNPPSFSQKDYNVTVREGEPGVKSLVKLSVSDADSGGRDNVTMSLLRPVRGYWLDGDSLMVNSSLLDCDESGPDLQHVISVLAVDGTRDGRQNSATATVTVQVKPVNEYAPVWGGEGNSSQPYLTFTHTRALGDPTPTLVATDRDTGPDGQIEYKLLSVESETMCHMNGTFQVETDTGKLMLASPVPDCPSCTVRLKVEARDLGQESRAVSGWVSLQLRVEDMPLNDTVHSVVHINTVVTEHLHIFGNTLILERKIFYTIAGMVEVDEHEKITDANKTIVKCLNITSVTDEFIADDVELVTETVVNSAVTSDNVVKIKEPKPKHSNSINPVPEYIPREQITVKSDQSKEYVKTSQAPPEALTGETIGLKVSTAGSVEVGSSRCESRSGVLLLQTMIGVLGFCLLLASCVIVCHKKTPAYVRPERLECEGCHIYPQIAPVSTKEGSYFST